MKALAAARCTHQRKGSANYFLVQTVSVIKELCGSVANADSLPPHTQPVHGSQARAGGSWLPTPSSVYTFTQQCSYLCFPCEIHHFLVGWGHETGQAAVGTFTLESALLTPSPASFPRTSANTSCPQPQSILPNWEGGRAGKGIMFLLGSVPPIPLICCGKALIAKQGEITHGPSGASWWKLEGALPKDLPGPGTSVAHGPTHRGSDLVATRKAICKHASREHMPRKKESIFVLLFFPVLAVIILFLF